MANRYWIAGGGTWNNSSTTHWSASSGGTSGASAPTSTDDVYFDENSFSADGQIVTLAIAYCNNINATGITYNVTFFLNDSSYIYGSATMNSKITWTTGGYWPQLFFSGNNVHNIKSNEMVWTCEYGLFIIDGTTTLLDDLIARRLHIMGGIFDANDFDVSTTSDIINIGNSNAQATDVVVYMGNGDWTPNCQFTIWGYPPHTATIYPEDSTIKFDNNYTEFYIKGINTTTFGTFNNIEINVSTNLYFKTDTLTINNLITNSGTLKITSGKTVTTNTLTAVGQTTTTKIQCETYGSTSTLYSNIPIIQNIGFTGIIANGDIPFDATNSGRDGGHNTNIWFGEQANIIKKRSNNK